MGKKTLLMYGILGAGVWYFLSRAKKATEALAASRAAAAAAATQPVLNQLPTDSMMPGIMPGAVQGMINDGARQVKMSGLNNLGLAVGITPMKPAKQRAPYIPFTPEQQAQFHASLLTPEHQAKVAAAKARQTTPEYLAKLAQLRTAQKIHSPDVMKIAGELQKIGR